MRLLMNNHNSLKDALTFSKFLLLLEVTGKDTRIDGIWNMGASHCVGNAADRGF